MIYLKTKEEIEAIRQGGKLLANILKTLLKEVKPGKRTADLENMARYLISKAKAVPAFLNYPMGGNIYFPSALCVSINNEVVHGSALPDREIKNGDIVDLDIGMEWPLDKKTRDKLGVFANPHSQNGGYFTDMCATIGAGKISQEAKKLITTTRKCLEAAISQAKPGNYINDIAKAVEMIALKKNYGVVRDLVGHGVGYFPHEAPDVFNYQISNNSKENVRLEPGMVIAIEPMINSGSYQIKIAKNGYTIITADDSLSAHFEHTVAITENGPQILTAI
jgi:methionyl aminopeptidase